MLSGAMSRCRKSPLCTISSASSSGARIAVELGLARRALEALQPGLEAAALLELQHHVAGVVGEEVAVHAHDVGVNEAGERPRLLDEALEPPLVVLGAALRARRGLAGGAAGGVVGGKVFLDGDEPGQRRLVGEIGDAEAAGAQHALDAIVANQLRPLRQRQQVGVGRRVGLLHCHSHRGPTDDAHAGSIPRQIVMASFALRRAHSSARCPRTELGESAGNIVAEEWAVAWRTHGLFQAAAVLAMFPPSCSGRDLLKELEMQPATIPAVLLAIALLVACWAAPGLLAAASAAGDRPAPATWCAKSRSLARRAAADARHLERGHFRRSGKGGGSIARCRLSASAGAGARPVRAAAVAGGGTPVFRRAGRSAPPNAAGCQSRRPVASRSCGGIATRRSRARLLPCGRTRPGSRRKTATPARCRSPARRSASAGTRTTTSACPIRPSTAITR